MNFSKSLTGKTLDLKSIHQEVFWPSVVVGWLIGNYKYDKLKKDFNGKPLDSCLLITNHEILSDPRTLLLNWCMPTIIHGPKISTGSVIHQS